jgi:NAD-dependent DNA ligase
MTHIDPQLIKDLRANPYLILQKLTIKEIVQLLKQAVHAYHQEGKPLFPDEIYEIIREYLAKLAPDHPLVQTDIVGAAPNKKDKVQLPVWMGSMNKVKDDPDLILKWKSSYSGTYVISDKLDGISCLYRRGVDGKVTLYTRGNGSFGQDCSHLLKHIRNLPSVDGHRSEILVRGELVISKQDWKKLKEIRTNPRNTVAGLANSKKIDPAIAELVQFIAYDCIEPSGKTPQEAFVWLKSNGFKPVFNVVCSEKQLNADHLSEILLQRRNASEFEIDGIIVNHNRYYEPITEGNPPFAFAFKSVLTLEKAEVVVNEVKWGVSKNGLLKPVVHFDTVFIGGAHIQRATAHNAQFIVKNKIGPGSRIVVIRSGMVIPYILEVITPSASGEPSYPDVVEYPWKWNENKVELALINPQAAKEYHLKQLENYVGVLGLKALGPKLIKLLYDRGIDSIKKLMNVSKVELYKATYSSKLTMKIFTQIQDLYRKGTCIEFMAASNIFGAGFGKRRFQLVVDAFPDVLENRPPSLTELMQTRGVGERFARYFLESLGAFHEFMEDVGLPCRSGKQEIEPTPDGFLVLAGKTVVFTGFRSKELEQFIVKRGGKVMTNVSSSTSIVVAKNPNDNSIKAETAKELGIPIMSSAVFIEETGYVETPRSSGRYDQEAIDREFEELKAELEAEGEFDELDDDGEDGDEDDANQLLNKTAECVRHTLNWANMKRTHIFGKSQFDDEAVRQDLPKMSPKLVTLLRKIEQLDKQDMEKHGRVFKHMIFSDVVKRGYGAKVVASALASTGYVHAYDKDFVIDKRALIRTKGKNFAILASTQIYTKPISNEFKKKLLSTFNARPDNIHGDLIRIMVLDSGYKEGIDLFDVKYVHLYEPLLNYADEMQAIGRATRFCGQKGLSFDEKNGWKLHVYKYDHVLKESIAKEFGGHRNSLEMIFAEMNRDTNLLKLSRDIERLCQEGAVDRALTRSIHAFSHQPVVGVVQQKGGSGSSSEALDAKIKKEYGHLTWPQVYVENLCKGSPAAASGGLLELTPSQQFIRQYFQPSSSQKGMFLYHSLGSGKSCTAIAAASYSWEVEGYTIIWVTRGTLRSDVYKNMFDISCLERIRDYIKAGNKLPEDMAAKKRLLSKSWIPPISYRQLNNTLNRQNRLYDLLIKRNGFSDPFKKTLLIIDEAHLMFSPTVKEKEKPDVNLLKAWIRNSYNVSKGDSVRVLLMSATPITDDPFTFSKLMNLTGETDMPDTEEEFKRRYLDENLAFTEKGKKGFKEDIAGRVSYLNRMRDVRQFAQPVIHDIEVPISEPADLNVFLEEIAGIEERVKELKTVKVGDTKKALLAEIEAAYEKPLADCEQKPKVAEKKACIGEVKKKMREEKATVDERVKSKVAEAKSKIAEAKVKIKNTKIMMKETRKNDASALSTLRKRCYAKKRDAGADVGSAAGANASAAATAKSV